MVSALVCCMADKTGGQVLLIVPSADTAGDLALAARHDRATTGRWAAHGL
jgi:hypothetical protein